MSVHGPRSARRRRGTAGQGRKQQQGTQIRVRPCSQHDTPPSAAAAGGNHSVAPRPRVSPQELYVPPAVVECNARSGGHGAPGSVTASAAPLLAGGPSHSCLAGAARRKSAATKRDIPSYRDNNSLCRPPLPGSGPGRKESGRRRPERAVNVTGLSATARVPRFGHAAGKSSLPPTSNRRIVCNSYREARALRGGRRGCRRQRGNRNEWQMPMK